MELLEKFAKWLGAESAVEEWTVTVECPIYWPSWCFEYLINHPYHELLPGNILCRSRSTGKVWKK
jgi:hypothetical protein